MDSNQPSAHLGHVQNVIARTDALPSFMENALILSILPMRAKPFNSIS